MCDLGLLALFSTCREKRVTLGVIVFWHLADLTISSLKDLRAMCFSFRALQSLVEEPSITNAEIQDIAKQLYVPPLCPHRDLYRWVNMSDLAISLPHLYIVFLDDTGTGDLHLPLLLFVIPQDGLSGVTQHLKREQWQSCCPSTSGQESHLLSSIHVSLVVQPLSPYPWQTSVVDSHSCLFLQCQCINRSALCGGKANTPFLVFTVNPA